MVPASTGIDNMRKELAPPLVILLALSSAVLVIACANLANLLLARGSGRRVEFAVRTALGAARGRLLAESLMESVVCFRRWAAWPGSRSRTQGPAR